MADAIDLLQCPACGTFYKPEITATGRLIAHCCQMPAYMPHFNLSLGQRIEAAVIEMHFRAIERRVVRSRLTDGVVGPPLTGSLLDIEV